jgi:aminopeptidase N
MRGRFWAAAGGIVASLALSAPAFAQTYTPGGRTLGDRLPELAHLGNTGYDAQHYDLTLNYDPVANVFQPGTKADITLRATQNLSEFALDFRGLNVTGVTIDGVAATFTRENDDAAYRNKLIVTPAAGIDNGRVFHVVVAYEGTPTAMEDPDESFEGWIRTVDGSFVVNEPMGAMTWFPNNNHPADKALYDFHITVPATHTALGNGELVGPNPPALNDDGATRTWNWHDGYPTATYLTTATVGVFDFTIAEGATAKGASGNALGLYNAWESTFTDAQKASLTAAAEREDQIVAFEAGYTGVAYPFDSIGAVADRLPSSLGYVLEVQTKIHFPSERLSLGTLSHEIAHQWFGNSVSLEQWTDIWLNEGFATWFSWNWGSKFNNGASLESQFNSNYNRASNNWSTPPANLPNARVLFSNFPVYTRPATMIEGLRQIMGEPAFQALIKAWQTTYRHGNADTAEFIALAKQIAAEKGGFVQANLDKLDTYFQQWLFGTTKPTLNPTTFFESSSTTGTVGGDVPATLALTLGDTATFGSFAPGVEKTYTAETVATVTSTAGDATLSVSEPGHLTNGAFTMPEPLQVAFSKSSWDGPTLGAEPVTVTFSQPVKPTDALRTGTYSQTLTFTLSTTTP